MLEQALVHGRFQPPHNQHLEYLVSAKQRCSFLWIGITRYDARDPVPSPVAPHRQFFSSNPLTFFERIEAITYLLQDAGIARGDFGFIPFPIEQPEKIENFIRHDIHCFTTVCDDWNLHKLKILKELGFTVEVLIDRRQQAREDVITGSQIRNMVLANDIRWRKFVPNGTLRVLDSINFPIRLQTLVEMERSTLEL